MPRVRLQATAAQASYGYVPTAVASDADVNADVMRAGLLDGVILPLAATRQGFANGDMFYLALWDWMEVKACEGAASGCVLDLERVSIFATSH